MEKLIACCGLNCETCDARIANIQNSDELRKATAETWQKMFNAPEIPFESINCTGCRMEGFKFAHCTTCRIRTCVNSMGYETCGDCAELETCDIVAFVLKSSPDAITNLKKLN
ncbi:MAG TPA: DUF3795 domain-containing protein [Bacteroidales bacterium]|nr:DUF3795 domain-containing protein [Bacteroidales bacterium]